MDVDILYLQFFCLGTQMYVSYYSLCDVGSCKIVCSSKIPNSVDLKPAKELVQRMKMYIENGLANPMYEKYYVSNPNLN